MQYPAKYINNYKRAIEIRALQLAIAESYDQSRMRCPVHLSIGQEYWLPVLQQHLKQGTRCYSTHRSHSMYMAVGGCEKKLILELLGEAGGTVRGIGGSMHLKELSLGLEASVPIVGSSIAMALGSALAQSIEMKDY